MHWKIYKGTLEIWNITQYEPMMSSKKILNVQDNILRTGKPIFRIELWV